MDPAEGEPGRARRGDRPTPHPHWAHHPHDTMPFEDGLSHKRFSADFTLYEWSGVNDDGEVVWSTDDAPVMALPLVRRCAPVPSSAFDRA